MEMVYTFDVMMIVRLSTHTLTIITRKMDKLNTHSPIFCVKVWDTIYTIFLTVITRKWISWIYIAPYLSDNSSKRLFVLTLLKIRANVSEELQGGTRYETEIWHGSQIDVPCCNRHWDLNHTRQVWRAAIFIVGLLAFLTVRYAIFSMNVPYQK